jgi:O-methyltransferase/methyltransferase family protein
VSVPPRVQLLNLAAGFMITQTIGALVRLGIPELVTERPRSVSELADASGANPDALRRALRALASLGIFEQAEGVVRHTELSELLRRDAPSSIEGQARLFSGFQYATWADAFETFRTGEPAFARVHGKPMFDWFDDHPDEADTFNRAMEQRGVGRRTPLLERDWSRERTVVDVGGGTGATLTALLAAHPHLSGTIVDLEHARAGAEAAIAAAGLGDRCAFVAGSFFEELPAGADAYVLSAILHDWSDERASAILRTCRAAMRPDARLFLVEAVIAPGDDPDWMKLLDLHMLVALGGRERSEDEWRDLLTANGFRLEPLAVPGLLEAAPHDPPR